MSVTRNASLATVDTYYGVVKYCFGRGKPEHGVSSGPRNVVCQIVKRTMRKAHKVNQFSCHTPSSESYKTEVYASRSNNLFNQLSTLTFSFCNRAIYILF